MAIDRLDVTSEAADWYARLRSGATSEVDAARFRAWLAAHPSHRQEFDELEAVWSGLAAIEHSPEVEAEVRARTHERFRSYRRPVFALAASLLMVLAIGVIGMLASDRTETYRTAVGEQRVVPLEDGSLLMLNTSTEVLVHSFTTQRRVELLTGQAAFDVAKDPDRPFIVTAGNGEVRALGTKFDVYKTGDTVVVTLLEGVVSVLQDVTPTSSGSTGDAMPAPQPVLLRAGEQLAYAKRPDAMPAAAAVASKVARADVSRVSAWTERKLSFDDTPLAEAVAEANRYSNVKIELRASSLEEVRISGIFEAGKNEAFAQALRAHLGLTVQHVSENRIMLTESE